MKRHDPWDDKVLCPRCEKRYLPIGYPGALSRADNKTEICSECGNDEGLLDFYDGYVQPVRDWPVTVTYEIDLSIEQV